jgi:hypothetical protein
VGEVGGQVAVGVDLGEEVVGFLRDRGNGIRTGDEPLRRVVELGDGDEGGGELAGPPWWPFMLRHASIVELVRSV